MWIYDDGGYDTVHLEYMSLYNMFENLCFISDILRKNHGHVIVKVYGNDIGELYNGSVIVDLAE